MHSVNLFFSIKPISINESLTVCGNVMRNTTQKKKFDSDINKLLSTQIKAVRKIASWNIEKNIGLYVRYIFWIPQKKIMTKKGSISKTGGDAANYEKSLTDVIFKRLKKHNSNLDDSQIVKMIIEKKISANNRYGISAHFSQMEIK